MADLIITERENITAVADEIRSLVGQTSEMTLGGMVDQLKSANSDKGEIITALKESGTVVNDNASLSNVTDLVEQTFDKYTNIEDSFVSGTISGTYENSRVTTIGKGAFFSNYNITSVNFPNVSTIGTYAFYLCQNLSTASFPKAKTIGYNSFRDTNFTTLTSKNFPVATTIGSKAFSGCTRLSTVNLPKVSTISSCAFYDCYNLTNVSFPAARNIYSEAFYGCSKLSAIYLTGDDVCKLRASNVFSGTKITSSTGAIYVHPDLVDTYKMETYWSLLSNRIFPDA